PYIYTHSLHDALPILALLPEANEKGAMPADKDAAKPSDAIYDLISLDGHKNYDARDLLATIIDADSFDEYKPDYGKTLVTAYARSEEHTSELQSRGHL